jgi:lysophospholipase L1-like esterase
VTTSPKFLRNDHPRYRYGRRSLFGLVAASVALALPLSGLAVATQAQAINVSGKATPKNNSLVVRALGDSITAAFGHYGNGKPMKIKDLIRCGTISYPNLNDRCSSNTPLGPGTTDPVTFLPDYGFKNRIAWPVQTVRQLGLKKADVDYANRAVTGADPKDLLPVDTTTQSGQLRDQLTATVADNPDLTLMTIGANPLLGDFLAGPGTKCLLKKRDRKFRTCSRKLVASEQVKKRVKKIVSNLLRAENNHVVLSLYPTVLPSTAVGPPERILAVLGMVNSRVLSAAKAQNEWKKRVFVSKPPLFPYGLAPGKKVCPGRPDVGLVDGVSVQSTITQDRFKDSTKYKLCSGPKRWIISSDLGVHPTKAGHRQIASSASALIERKLIRKGRI